MNNTESSSVKHRYDITKSKRTRKQPPFSQQNNEKSISVGDLTKEVSLENLLEVKEGDQNDHKSLKQLINGDGKDKGKLDEGGKGRKELGQHFTEEEKHLQLAVRRQQHESVEGLKLKKLVRRYAKVLSHLMKTKRDPRLGGEPGKKPVLKLPK